MWVFDQLNIWSAGLYAGNVDLYVYDAPLCYLKFQKKARANETMTATENATINTTLAQW
jgi:hypothetical protein